MDHRIPRIGVVVSILLAFGALLTFVFLNQRFEGPDPTAALRSPYELTARFASSNTLPTKQDVLYKGVSVGRVNAVDYDEETQEAVVTFTITDQVETVYADAQVQIGERSLLGDAYLNLVDPGTPNARELEAGDEVEGTLPTVNFDEALDFLDEAGRKRVRSLIGTTAEGLSGEGNGYRLNGTIGGLARTVRELRRLTDSLRGQERQIADLVSDSATVLDELSARETAVRSIVGSGRATLDAVAANTTSLQRALDELPLVLGTGRRTLAASRPLLSEARPVLSRLGEISPTLSRALDDRGRFSVRTVASDLATVIEALPAQRRASERVLPDLARLNRLILPVVQKAGPAALNAVPIADYLAPRTNSFGAFYANAASAVAGGDEVGRYGRFGVVADPGLLADSPHDGRCSPRTGTPASPGSGFCYNAYPRPNDSLDHRPFSGEYPRLVPYAPPDPDTLAGGE